MTTRSLPLPAGTDPGAWMAEVLKDWGLGPGPARAWLPVLRPALEQGVALVVELDAPLGLVSVEVRDAGGRALIGLDDLVGSPAGGLLA